MAIKPVLIWNKTRVNSKNGTKPQNTEAHIEKKLNLQSIGSNDERSIARGHFNAVNQPCTS